MIVTGFFSLLHAEESKHKYTTFSSSSRSQMRFNLAICLMLTTSQKQFFNEMNKAIIRRLVSPNVLFQMT